MILLQILINFIWGFMPHSFLLMNITQYDLKNLKSVCSRVCELVDYIQSSDKYQNLFLNRNDYEESLRSKQYLPDEFYNFRLFDVYSCIRYNAKIKKYMIILKNYYSNVLDNYKNNQRNLDSFIISENFDETLDVWSDVLYDILSNQIKHNGLF